MEGQLFYSLNRLVASLLDLHLQQTTKDPQVLIVTISGDVDLSRDLIEVSATAGFSSDGAQTLDEAEPTMFFRNQDFIAVSGGHLSCGNNDDESCD
ncbi:hypothetical protein [Bacillus thuringiensis]